jgi:hypothetical protein
MLRRPALPDDAAVATIEEALAWIDVKWIDHAGVPCAQREV